MNILSIGEKIKKKRKKLGMTLKDLAGNRVTTGQISLIESGKSNPSMDLLEYLAKNLETSVEYLLESEQKQAIKICEYYENMAFCYLFEKNISEVELCLSEMVAISDKYNLEQIRYKIYFIKGVCLYKLKSYDKAVEKFLISNLGFLKFSMNEELIQSFLYLGYIAIEEKNYVSAVVHLECVIKIIDKHFLNYDLMFFKVYYLASKSYVELGNMEKSSYYLKICIDILNKLYNPKENAVTFMEKSMEYMKLEDLDNAVKFSYTSRRYFEELNILNDRQFVENRISEYFIEKNELYDGKKHLRRAKSIDLDYGFDNLFEIYKNFVTLYVKGDNIDKAKCYLFKLEESLNMKKIDNVMDFYMLKYKIHMIEENYSDAEIVLILGYNFAKDFGEYKKAGDFCLVLSKFYIDIKKNKEAENMIEEALVQYRRVGYKLSF